MRYKKLLALGLVSLVICGMTACRNGETEEELPPAPQPVTQLYLQDDCLILKEGEVTELAISANSPDFDERLVSWESSSDCVVVAAGTLFARASGQAEITATYGEVKTVAKVGVTFVENGTYAISHETLVLDDGQTGTLGVLRNGAPYSNVAWKSADVGVASVEAGVVRAHGAGKTLVSAQVHGTQLFCSVVVAGVDGGLDEWYRDGQPCYRGVTLTDIKNEARGFTIWARKTQDGVFFGGYALHATLIENAAVWHQNTNFEVQIAYGDRLIQYYASSGFRSAGAEGVIRTYVNSSTVGAADRYRSDFELFVPYETEQTYVRAGIAFKTPGETIAMIRGGNEPFVSNSDWWWADLHCPSNAEELYYIYDDGIYAAEREGNA